MIDLSKGETMLQIRKPKNYMQIVVVCLVVGWALSLVWLIQPKTADATSAEASVQMVPMSFSELAEKIRPGVVNIRTVKTIKGGGPVFRHFFGNPFERPDPNNPFGPFRDEAPSREFKQRSLGSGFIIDQKGYIVTNNHVIEDADEIVVRLFDEREFQAKVVGRDSKTDLALIRIEGVDNLKALKMGDSDKLKIGSWVMAMGSPFGLEQTVTAGIVSAKGRFIGAGPYDDFIQTDASINPGNSGGPLVNMEGEVVGINTAIIAQGQGIGFAIPVDLARDIIAQLKESGSVTRGWLGVGIQDLTGELAEYYGLSDKAGVLVTQVFEGDPADKAGIKPNDIITAVDGTPVKSARELSSLIAGIPVGKKTELSLLRDGKEKSVTVNIAKREDAEAVAAAQPSDKEELGIRITNLTPEIAKQLNLPENEKGVVVAGVKADSKAAEAGLRQGDLIKEINRKPVETVEDFKNEMNKSQSGEMIQLLVKRANSGFAVIKIEK
jgi:serine protease Do